MCVYAYAYCTCYLVFMYIHNIYMCFFADTCVWHEVHPTGAGSRASKQGGGRGAGRRGPSTVKPSCREVVYSSGDAAADKLREVPRVAETWRK